MNKKSIRITMILAILGIGVLYYFTIVKPVKEDLPKGEIYKDISQEIDDGTDIVRDARGVGVGEEAPNFTLRDLNGEEVSLEDYRGKIVLVNFWATWCGFCDAEMPDIQNLSEENDDLVVLAVDVMESKDIVEKYIEEGKYDFQVLLDEDGEVARTYLVSGLPASYFIDENGIIFKKVPGMMQYEYMDQTLDELRESQ